MQNVTQFNSEFNECAFSRRARAIARGCHAAARSRRSSVPRSPNVPAAWRLGVRCPIEAERTREKERERAAARVRARLEGLSPVCCSIQQLGDDLLSSRSCCMRFSSSRCRSFIDALWVSAPPPPPAVRLLRVVPDHVVRPLGEGAFASVDLCEVLLSSLVFCLLLGLLLVFLVFLVFDSIDRSVDRSIVRRPTPRSTTKLERPVRRPVDRDTNPSISMTD